MEMSAWLLIPALMVVGLVVFAYFMGVEVGKDTKQITAAFWDGYECGVEASIETVRQSLDGATIYEQMLAEQSQRWDKQ